MVEKRKRPRIFMSPHVEGAVYTALMIEHDDPDNDPRAWDWSLVDFSGVTDRRVIVMCVGFWENDSKRKEKARGVRILPRTCIGRSLLLCVTLKGGSWI